MLHLYEEPGLGRTTDKIEKQKKRVLHPEGSEPTTSLSRGVWSTAVLKPVPIGVITPDARVLTIT